MLYIFDYYFPVAQSYGSFDCPLSGIVYVFYDLLFAMEPHVILDYEWMSFQ